jgi:hypothetical protein
MQGNRRSRRGMLAAIVVAGAAALTATVSAGADTLADDGAGSRAGIEAPAQRFVQDEQAPEGSQDRPGKDCPEREGDGDGAGAGGSATPESGGTATPTPEV